MNSQILRHIGKGAPPVSSHALRSETILARTAVLFRVGALAQLAAALPTAVGHFRHASSQLLVVLLVIFESAVLIGVWWRNRKVGPRQLTVDVAFCATALLTNSGLSASDVGHTWTFYMYPFSLLASVALGVGYRRPWQVTTAAGTLAASYLAASVELYRDPLWNAIPNSASYFANSLIIWLIGRELRRSARAADLSEAAVVDRAAELGREQESNRYNRMLHDRVLQTMEMLATDTWLADHTIRAHVRNEAAWLRALIAGGSADRTGDLFADLQAVISDQIVRGLRVEFNGSALLDPAVSSAVPPTVAEAVCGATREALTNVAKHACVNVATVRAALDWETGSLVVSVVDHGAGFDPSAGQGSSNRGLAESIKARIIAVGGQARIISAPGTGTEVELRVPLPGAD